MHKLQLYRTHGAFLLYVRLKVLLDVEKHCGSDDCTSNPANPNTAVWKDFCRLYDMIIMKFLWVVMHVRLIFPV